MVRINDAASGMSPERFLYTLLFDKEEKMKKYIVLILIVAFLMISFGCSTIAGNVPASNGPAPSSGDNESEGPEFVVEPPFGNEDDGRGPAPNSGDGISDESGF